MRIGIPSSDPIRIDQVPPVSDGARCARLRASGGSMGGASPYQPQTWPRFCCSSQAESGAK